MITYDSHVKPFENRFILIEIDHNTRAKIDNFVGEIVEKKKKESHHRFDNKSHYKRYYTGTLGEVALEKFLGVSHIVDWTVGDSKDYHQPDLKSLGINAGIKTVGYGLFPVIFKKSYSNEIIMLCFENRYIYICGLATKEVLNKNQSDELIKDSRLRAKGTKTGFYGFNELLPFRNVQELRKITF